LGVESAVSGKEEGRTFELSFEFFDLFRSSASWKIEKYDVFAIRLKAFVIVVLS